MIRLRPEKGPRFEELHQFVDVGNPEVGPSCLSEHHSHAARPRIAGRDARLPKGKDAESEEAQEHANSSSLALYA